MMAALSDEKTIRRAVRAVLVVEGSGPRGWGGKPTRSLEHGKFLVSTGKNQERAQRIADALAALPPAQERGLKFFVEQDPGKGEWAVFLAYPFARAAAEWAYYRAQSIKKDVSTR